MSAVRKARYALIIVLHDYVLFGALWLTSRRFREHQAYVKSQRLHLNGLHSTGPVADCTYCALRAQG